MRIVLLHTRRGSLLKRAFETAFPSLIHTVHVPALEQVGDGMENPEWILDYFRRHVYDPEVWADRVLAIYGSGTFHHWTYALSRLALERRRLRNWTYFHFDQHRDDYDREDFWEKPAIDCGCFVDTLVADHGATPFFIGPDPYPYKDVKGYLVGQRRVPIYHNRFPRQLHQAYDWRWVRNLSKGPAETWSDAPVLPRTRDLRETPTESYLSFDLDLLPQSEMVTDYDQNEDMTLRRLCQIVDKVRQHKRVFSADILGLPEPCNHALSCLSMVILARKLLGLGTKRLLQYHTWAKQKQARRYGAGNEFKPYWQAPRESPISTNQLLEVLHEHRY